MNRIFTPAQIAQAIDELMAWPLRVTQVRAFFADAWRLRANVTFADGVYVALAEHLGAELLSDDGRLANAPGLPVWVLHLRQQPVEPVGVASSSIGRRRR